MVIDGRISNNPCTAFLGKVFSLKPGHPVYPALSSIQGGGPPFHPNCTKGISAYIPELASSAQAKAAIPDADTAAIAKAGANTQAGRKLYQDLQLRQQTEGRLQGIVPQAGRKIQTTSTDDPKFQEQLIRDMGVEAVHLAGRADIGALVVKGLQQAKAAGMTLPAAVQVERVIDRRTGRPSPDTVAQADGRTMIINSDCPDWRDMRKAVREAHDGKVYSSSDPRHPVFHEAAHCHFNAVGPDWRNAPLDPRDRQVAARVSGRAKRNKDEFVAEVTAARMAGVRYDDEVMALYRRLISR